jgi:hypothetical protein
LKHVLIPKNVKFYSILFYSNSDLKFSKSKSKIQLLSEWKAIDCKVIILDKFSQKLKNCVLSESLKIQRYVGSGGENGILTTCHGKLVTATIRHIFFD